MFLFPIKYNVIKTSNSVTIIPCTNTTITFYIISMIYIILVMILFCLILCRVPIGVRCRSIITCYSIITILKYTYIYPRSTSSDTTIVIYNINLGITYFSYFNVTTVTLYRNPLFLTPSFRKPYSMYGVVICYTLCPSYWCTCFIILMYYYLYPPSTTGR